MNIQLTDREADVMQLLWDRGPSIVAEVRAGLKDDLAYTTVLTVLRTLEAKGYVGHDRRPPVPQHLHDVRFAIGELNVQFGLLLEP